MEDAVWLRSTTSLVLTKVFAGRATSRKAEFRQLPETWKPNGTWQPMRRVQRCVGYYCKENHNGHENLCTTARCFCSTTSPPHLTSLAAHSSLNVDTSPSSTYAAVAQCCDAGNQPKHSSKRAQGSQKFDNKNFWRAFFHPEICTGMHVVSVATCPHSSGYHG